MRRIIRVPSLIFSDLLVLTLLVGLGSIVAVMAVVAIAAQFRTVGVSGWAIFSQFVPWIAAYFGGYVFYRYLPVYVAHGQTRREFYRQALVFIVAFASLIAVITTVGYGVERVVYDFADWQRDNPGDHLFSTFGEYGLVFADYWFSNLVWIMVGSLIGAAWYRSEGLGVLSLVPALVLGSAIDIATGASMGGPFNALDRISIADSQNLILAVIVCAACMAVGFWLIWSIVREVPIRNR